MKGIYKSIVCSHQICRCRGQRARPDDVSDADMHEVFRMIDYDESGVISAEEFAECLCKDESADYKMTYDAFERSMFELVDHWATGVSEVEYHKFAVRPGLVLSVRTSGFVRGLFYLEFSLDNDCRTTGTFERGLYSKYQRNREKILATSGSTRGA